MYVRMYICMYNCKLQLWVEQRPKQILTQDVKWLLTIRMLHLSMSD